MLADIGKFSALALLFCILVLRLPALSFLTLAVCPIPIIFVAARRGAKAGLAVIVVLGVILVLVNGVTNTLPILFFVGFLSLGYTWGVGRDISFSKLVAVGTAIVATSLVLLGLLTVQVQKVNIVEQQIQGVKKDFAELREEYIRRGVSKEQVEEQSKTITDSLKIFPKILPAAIIIFSIWIAFMSIALTGVVLKSAGESVFAFPAFKMWQFPWYFAWGYIIGLIGSFFSGYLGAYKEIGSVIGMNFLVVFNLLFLVQGFAIIYFFMDKVKLRNYLRALSFGLIVVIPVASPFVVWFGLLDVWFNFRKLPAEAES
jgi:uncharacterized protein YybS (DUF2232 family)